MIAICGATGKIGGTAARILRARGASVTALVRDPDQATALREQGCAIARADLHDERSLRAALSNAEQVLVICPVLPTSNDVMGDSQRIIDGLVAALKQTRPRHVLAISDYGAHVPSGTGITMIFNSLEARLRMLGVSTTLLRSAEHMQNWFRQLRAVRERGVLPSLHHPLSRSFPTVSAFDVGVIAAELLTSPHDASAASRVIHVEGPRRYAADDFAAAFAERLGREVTAREVPRADWESTLRAGGLTPSYAALVSQLQDAHNRGVIDVEPGGEVRRGTTELATALADLPHRP